MIWLILVGVVLYLLYLKFVKPLSIWSERGLPHRTPWPFVGNCLPEMLGRISFVDGLINVYKDFYDRRYNGYFQFMEPYLVVRDVDLIKQITVKNFDHFTDHQNNIDPHVDPLMGTNLFFMKGQDWKDMRSTLSPVFTSSKLREMFPYINECAENFVNYFKKKNEKIVEVEVKDALTRFANDVIATTAFGFKCNSLVNQEDAFYTNGKKMTDFSGWNAVRFMISNIAPKLLTILNMPLLGKGPSEFFSKIIKDSIHQREKEGIVRKDLIHLMLEARKGRLKHEDTADPDAGFATVQESDIGKSNPSNIKMTDDLICAQAMIFFFAGFDTISSGMSFILYELAINPEIQERLREEIDGLSSEGKIEYEAVLKLKYLDMVVSEGLRKWPPGILTDRECTKDFTIEPQLPHEEPYTIRKGEHIMVPVFGLHRDPKYYPNPDKFDPERFSDEHKDNIVPYSYMPFGLGPRACIGSRFALLEAKIMLVHLLSKFEVVPIEKTPIPLKFEKKSFNFTPEGGMWMGFKQRSN